MYKYNRIMFKGVIEFGNDKKAERVPIKILSQRGDKMKFEASINEPQTVGMEPNLFKTEMKYFVKNIADYINQYGENVWQK